MNILLMALGFIVGSIPFGLVIAKLRGIDLRKTGSGNIGATNVLRCVGKGAALLTLIGDIGKGAAFVALARATGMNETWAGIVGLCVIVGHDYSVFMSFKGGKGVATSLGVITILSPIAGLATVGIWLLTALVTRYSSLSAILSFVFLPVNYYILYHDRNKILFGALLAALILFKHRGNISRLADGTEGKIGQRKAPRKDADSGQAGITNQAPPL